MSAPWMPLYVADYLADTGHLSAAEHGAYLMLIMHYWRAGSLPKDEKALARVARMSDKEWKKSRDTIAAFFDADWKHERIENELQKSSDKSGRRAEAGSRGGNAKALKTHDTPLANATILPEQKPSIALASSSQSQPHEDTNVSSARDEALSKFRIRISETYVRANSPVLIDTARAAIWLANGWNPEICCAVISEIVTKKPSISSLKYFDQPIADAHQKPEAKGPAPTAYKSPVVDKTAGKIWASEGDPIYERWLSERPGFVKSIREERRIEGSLKLGAYFPSEHPPKVKEAAA